MAVVLTYFAAYAGVLLLISLFRQLGEHFSPVHAGLTLVPMMIGMVTAMVASLALGDKLGRRQVHIGVALVGAGIIAVALTASGTHLLSTWDLAPSLFVIGLGASLSFSQLFDIVLAGVSLDEVGSASGVRNAVEQLASALGVAGLGTVFFARLTADHHSTGALATTAWATLIPLALTFALVFRLPKHGRTEAKPLTVHQRQDKASICMRKGNATPPRVLPFCHRRVRVGLRRSQEYVARKVIPYLWRDTRPRTGKGNSALGSKALVGPSTWAVSARQAEARSASTAA